MDELDQAACLADFFQLYLADADRGSVGDLAHYTARFPGHAELVAREYAALCEHPALGRDDATTLPALSGYRVLRELGRGGQGTVYLAEDVALRRLVALKVVHTTLGRPSPTQRARLEREVGILAQLDHPGICTVFRAHLDADPPFVAMRYVSGPTLADVIAMPSDATPPCAPSRRADVERLLGFFEDAARALHVAHEAGIVHRDIKPGNIVCGDDGKPVLLDFGLARPVDEDGLHLTLTGQVFGTPAYMSPEQLLRPADALDRRTDVYSLGVTLFECLTSTRPFDEPSQRQLERAICEDPPPRVCRANPALPTDLDVVLATALEKDVRRRYATALDLAEELRRVRERRPVLARPTSAVLRARRWIERNPVVATAVLLLALGAAGLSLALARLSAESARTRDALRLAESRTLAASALTMLERDPVQALDLALASEELEPGVHSRTALYRALADQQVERVIELPVVANVVAISPREDVLAAVGWDGVPLIAFALPDGRHLLDVALPSPGLSIDVTDEGRQLAVGLADGRILVHRDGDASPALSLAAHAGAVRSVAFSPDATLLASGGDDDLVRLWDVHSGRELAVLPGSLGPPCKLAFSPDGDLLASWVQELPDVPDRPDPIVRVWDVPGRRLAAALVGHAARVTTARFSHDGRLFASASDDGTARVWELPEGRCRLVLEHPGQVLDLAFSPDGASLATAFHPGPPGLSQAGGAWVFDVADGRLLQQLQGHEARPVSTIDWSGDGGRLVTGSYDGTARTWDAADGRELACVRSTQGIVSTVRWLAGDARILVRYRGSVTVVRAEGDAGLPRYVGHAAPIVHASFSDDSARVATCDTSGLTLVHDARTGELLARLDDGPATVLRTAWCGGRVVTASEDGFCRVFDADSGSCRLRVRVGREPVHLLRVLPDGAQIVASSGADAALFEVEDGDRSADFRGHEADLRCLDISPDGRLLATGAADRSVRVWDLATGACRAVLRDWLPVAYETERNVYAVLFHLDGSGLLTASEDGVMRDYRMPDGELVRSETRRARIGQMRWLPDGRRAALMCQWAPGVAVLPLETFTREQYMLPVVGRLLALDVSPDGSLVLTAGTDGTAMLCSTADSAHWASVEEHAGPVMFAGFTPDGSGFLTASTDGSARLWPTDPAGAARARRPPVVPLVLPFDYSP